MPVTIAPNKRVPGVYIAVDSSRATGIPTRKAFRAVLIGGKTSAGTLAQKTKQLVTNADQVRAFAGSGSMLHQMARKWFAQQLRPTVLEILALDDAGGSAAATVTVTVVVTTAQAGTLALMIGGTEVRVGVAAGDTASAIAANVRAAINAADGMAVAATGTVADVILTAIQKGSEGNQIDLRLNYFSDEALPGGVTITGAGNFTGGSNNPALDAATFTALGEVQYDVVACGFGDASNVGALHAELASRFSSDRQIQGNAFIAKRDTLANLVAFAAGKNSPHISMVGLKLCPNLPWEIAAAVTAVAGGQAEADPATPIQHLPLVGILPPKEVDRFTPAERETLLASGVATVVIPPSGEVQTERLITLYMTSPAGAPDVAFLDVETMFTCSLVRWAWATRTLLLHPNAKLANDGTRFGGQAGDVVTPLSRKAEWAAFYREFEEEGILEDFAGAMANSKFERDANDKNRLNETLAPDFVNQARIFADVLQFRL